MIIWKVSPELVLYDIWLWCDNNEEVRCEYIVFKTINKTKTSNDIKIMTIARPLHQWYRSVYISLSYNSQDSQHI